MTGRRRLVAHSIGRVSSAAVNDCRSMHVFAICSLRARRHSSREGGQFGLRVGKLAGQILKSSPKLVDLCFGGREKP